LYYGLSSWFIKVQDFKKRMLELNQGITWVPEHLRDGRFKHVLENAPDWNFSRNRFWASPLPIWKSKTGKMKFIGSVEELRAHAKPARNRYTLIRHGQAKSNITNTWDCGRDPENHLTDEGKGGVAESAARLKDAKIDLIVASPFLRAQETAAIVAEALGLSAADVIIDDRLSEWNVGTEFDRKTLDYFFDVRNAAHNRYSYEAHGGESFASVVKRCGECLYSLEERYEGKNILIVGHGSSIRALENVAEGFTYDQLLKREAKALNYKNAEFRSLDFKPLSHNENYELDLHRPYIDAVKLEIDGEEYTRIPEVIDCWFESGSMPFAQDHYPFERPDWMEKNFPADFVVEYIAQTRTWFYYTLLLSTMLFDRVPFTHVVTTGNLNGTDGQKMSKSKGNYPDPWILMNKYGADALRMYLMSSVLMKGEDSNFMEKSVDEIYKKIILRLENCLSFIDMYEVPKQVWGQGEAPTSELDRWIIARLSQVVAEMTTGFDGYNTVEATKGINLFVDDLSAWYLRRSRDRFKGDDVMDRTSAGKTLVTVLVEFAKAIAPVMPFIAETVYQKLRTADSKESVHLEAFPTAGEANESLLGTMQHVRDTVTLGLEARSKANIKVRQPLAKIAITIDWFDDECLSIIKDELNVKEVVVDKFLAEGTVALDTDITDALRDEGDMREMVRTIQDMRKAAGLMPSDRVAVSMANPEPA
jgi:isoleucyl-tRNA synthetase